MKLFFGWILLFILVLFSFYYINSNLEKTVDINELLNISNTQNNITYSAKNTDDKEEFIEFSLKKDSEIFLLSGNKTKNNKNNEKEIIIDIERTNKDVILILNSKDETIWNINPSENTNIKLIIYANNNKVISKKAIYKYKTAIDLDLSIQSVKFVNLLEYIKEITQKESIDYFYSADILEQNIKIKDIQSDPKLSLNYLSPKKTKINFGFKLISKDYEFIPFNLEGPVNIDDKLKEIKNNVVASPNKTKIYEIIKNGLKIINVSDKKETLKGIPILKEIAYPKGIAYDDLSDMVYIANKKGKFFIFDAQTEYWKSIRKYIDDYHINSLSYDTFTNTFLSSNWKKNELIIFDQKGNFETEYNLEDKLLGFNYHYKKSSPLPELYLVPNGNDIGIVLIDKFVQKIWLFNKSTKKAILTYNYRN